MARIGGKLILRNGMTETTEAPSNIRMIWQSLHCFHYPVSEPFIVDRQMPQKQAVRGFCYTCLNHNRYTDAQNPDIFWTIALIRMRTATNRIPDQTDSMKSPARNEKACASRRS